MRVIDFHSHWFSRTFFETLAAQSPLPGSVEEKLAFVSSKTGIEIPDPDPAVHGRRWLAEMDRHGVEHLCAFASLPEEAGVVAAAAAAAPQRLSAFTLINPRADGIAARLETPVLPIDGHRAAARPLLPWRRLAVAAVALVTVSAGVTWSVVRRDPASDGTPAVRAVRHAEGLVLDSLYGREIAVLREAAEGTLGQLDSATVAVVRRNLAIIDQAIRESRAALAADPGSPFLQEQLDRAYGGKVALLRRLTLL